MPNHITNYVEITGTKAKMDKLKKDCLSYNDKDSENRALEPEFDFNGIIKMPEEIRTTGSPCQVVPTQAQANKINKEREGSPYNDSITTWAITEGEKMRRLKKYGAVNWYDFACDNWGTKWGAYDVIVLHEDDKRLALEFNTAWSPPEPIFDELVKRGYKVNCIWQDEDPSNQGEYGDPYESFEIDQRISVDYIGNY